VAVIQTLNLQIGTGFFRVDALTGSSSLSGSI
jgi:hypothetical protein